MKFLMLILVMIIEYANNNIIERDLEGDLDNSCNDYHDCFNCTMFPQSCQWNSYQCQESNSTSILNNWWDQFIPCVADSSSYNRMKNFCDSQLERNAPFSVELVAVNSYYGTRNIYCRWSVVNNELTKFLVINFTKNNPDLTDRYGLEVIYTDGRTSFQTLQNKNFVYAYQYVDNIYFHYYSFKMKSEIPFTISFEYQEESYQSYLGLFISLAIIVFLCLLCSIFFYKCSRIIIENSHRQQERRAQEEMHNLMMNNNQLILLRRNSNSAEREEEIKKENLKKLKLLFESELKPVHYDKSLNEFGANCTICLEDFKINSKVAKLFCKHLFHLKCLENWCNKVLINPKCPNCNISIIPDQREVQDNLNINNVLHINIPRNNLTEEGKSDPQDEVQERELNYPNGGEQNLRIDQRENLENHLNKRMRSYINIQVKNENANSVSNDSAEQNDKENEINSNGDLLETSQREIVNSNKK